MIPVPIIGLLCASGGTVLGILIRQPEINKLKKNIKDLQKDNSRIKMLMEQQQKNLDNMLLEYSSIKFYHIREKIKKKQDIRGEIAVGYEYKEYVDLLQRAVKESGTDSFSEEEKEFFELSTQIVEGKIIDSTKEKFMSKYILNKYKSEILRMQDADVLNYVKKKVA